MGSSPQGHTRDMLEQKVVTSTDPSVVATSPTDNPVAQSQSPRSRRQKLHDADPNDYPTRYPSLFETERRRERDAARLAFTGVCRAGPLRAPVRRNRRAHDVPCDDGEELETSIDFRNG
jgi:hypothetical protein